MKAVALLSVSLPLLACSGSGGDTGTSASGGAGAAGGSLASGGAGTSGAGGAGTGGTGGAGAAGCVSDVCAPDSHQVQRCTNGQLGEPEACPKSAPACVIDSCAEIKGVPPGLSEGHSCVLLEGGAMACWGRNSAGQLGLGAGSLTEPYPRLVALEQIEQASLGRNHSCAVTSDGKLWCWGRNGDGEAFLGDSTGTETPTEVSLPEAALHVASGWRHSCVVGVGGSVWCSGRGENGQLGSGTVEDSSSPVQVMGLEDAVEVVVGEDHSCARRAGGGVACWGLGRFGQLGDGRSGPSVTSAIPVDVLTSADTPLSNVVALTSGGASACALDEAGTVLCWGRNQNGLFGLGVSSDENPYATTTAYSSTVMALAGISSLCALSASSLSCSGRNEWAQTGSDSGGDDVLTSTPIAGLDDVTTFGLQAAHGCALLADGTVECWGWNAYAQLGQGFGSQDGLAPVQVSWNPAE